MLLAIILRLSGSAIQGLIMEQRTCLVRRHSATTPLTIKAVVLLVRPVLSCQGSERYRQANYLTKHA